MPRKARPAVNPGAVVVEGREQKTVDRLSRNMETRRQAIQAAKGFQTRYSGFFPPGLSESRKWWGIAADFMP